MAQSVSVWLCLYLPLLLTEAKSIRQHDSQNQAVKKPASHINLDPVWITKHLRTQDDGPNQSLPVPEMFDLDLDQRRRLARGADEDEQLSTFSHYFENDSVTVPQLINVTFVADNDDISHQGNNSTSGREAPGLFNPFYPLVESSYAAYAILFLAGLVLAVGVVGNMAVMCIVWNNYYMRSAWNYLLASMAFWDFLVLVLCLPVVVLNQLSHRRILGDITCRMVPYMEVGGACFTC